MVLMVLIELIVLIVLIVLIARIAAVALSGPGGADDQARIRATADAVVGSIMRLTSKMRVAGKPLSSA